MVNKKLRPLPFFLSPLTKKENATVRVRRVFLRLSVLKYFPLFVGGTALPRIFDLYVNFNFFLFPRWS